MSIRGINLLQFDWLAGWLLRLATLRFAGRQAAKRVWKRKTAVAVFGIFCLLLRSVSQSNFLGPCDFARELMAPSNRITG